MTRPVQEQYVSPCVPRYFVPLIVRALLIGRCAVHLNLTTTNTIDTVFLLGDGPPGSPGTRSNMWQRMSSINLSVLGLLTAVLFLLSGPSKEDQHLFSAWLASVFWTNSGPTRLHTLFDGSAAQAFVKELPLLTADRYNAKPPGRVATGPQPVPGSTLTQRSRVPTWGNCPLSL